MPVGTSGGRGRPWTISVPLLLALVALLGTPSIHAQQTVGLFINDDGASPGYNLYGPLGGTLTVLISNDGRLINQWDHTTTIGNTLYLLENGDLLRAARFQPAGVTRFGAGGAGGRVERYDWDGTLVWGYDYSDEFHRHHHDIEPLPNGNVLLIAWELKTSAEAIAAGRNPALLPANEVWPETIVEVEPFGTSGGTIVWEWHLWDHLIQDFDPTKANFGVVADHPELVDVNFMRPGNPGNADWNHANAVDYEPTRDQILISVPFFDEVWVIDHSTTSKQATGHSGGNSGKGGDLLYRWGNPQSYDRGVSGDQKFFNQHDANFIDAGLPGAGNILVFNNGVGRTPVEFTTIDEIVPPVDKNGIFDTLAAGVPHGPAAPVSSYVADPPESFSAGFLSGAKRQPNGNTLICNGLTGTFFEVTPASETVWLYVNPLSPFGTTTQGNPPINTRSFRVTRYPVDYPGFDGRDLTPGDPIEIFTRPVPVPDGNGGTTPLLASRTAIDGSEIHVDWDVGSCAADDYNLIYGSLADVANYSTTGSECAIGIGGGFDWAAVPAGDLYYLIVGVDFTGTYESSWGLDSSGLERNGSVPSGTCAATTKDPTLSCP